MYNALIRTHHVTSRRKVARIKKAAQKLELSRVLIRSGGSPGLMYVEGSERGVGEWVDTVQNLRYKDFHVLRKPAVVDAVDSQQDTDISGGNLKRSEVEEVESVAAFASVMEQRGLLDWWRQAMGYIDP